MVKVENLEYWLAKFYLNMSIISQDIDIERISFLPINQDQLLKITVTENWRKMSCDNPKLGIVNNNMYAK